MFHAEQMFSKTQVYLFARGKKCVHKKSHISTLNFCSWRWPLLDAKDTKVERNIWLNFIHYPSDIKIVKVYHKACFTCGNCKKPLDRLTFISKLK